MKKNKLLTDIYVPEDPRDLPPTRDPIDTLSFTLKSDNKELDYLAVKHIFGIENKGHQQFAALKESFDRFKPQVVLYEGPQGNPTQMTEEGAYRNDEKAYIQYLVLEHNKNLELGEQSIVMESCGLQPEDEPEEYHKRGYTNEELATSKALKWMYYEVEGLKNTPALTEDQKAQKVQELQAKYGANPVANLSLDFFARVPRSDGQQWTADLIKAEIQKQTGQPLKVDLNYLELPRFKQMFEDGREVSDQYIVKKIAETAKQYDRVMVVMGSGHAIRERQALEQLYEAKLELPLAA